MIEYIRDLGSNDVQRHIHHVYIYIYCMIYQLIEIGTYRNVCGYCMIIFGSMKKTCLLHILVEPITLIPAEKKSSQKSAEDILQFLKFCK